MEDSATVVDSSRAEVSVGDSEGREEEDTSAADAHLDALLADTFVSDIVVDAKLLEITVIVSLPIVVSSSSGIAS